MVVVVQMGEKLAEVDAAIGELMQGLYQQDIHRCINIIIVADHGENGHKTQHYISCLKHFLCEFFSLSDIHVKSKHRGSTLPGVGRAGWCGSCGLVGLAGAAAVGW